MIKQWMSYCTFKLVVVSIKYIQKVKYMPTVGLEPKQFVSE